MGGLTTYVQYSTHLDGISIEDRMVDFDDREFDLENQTFIYRVDHDSYRLNTKPFVALKPEYKDRSKRIIFI